jgi:hypothetical protein
VGGLPIKRTIVEATARCSGIRILIPDFCVLTSDIPLALPSPPLMRGRGYLLGGHPTSWGEGNSLHDSCRLRLANLATLAGFAPRGRRGGAGRRSGGTHGMDAARWEQQGPPCLGDFGDEPYTGELGGWVAAIRPPAPGASRPWARHIPLLGILLDRVLPINRPLCAFRALRRRAITDTALWSQRFPFGLYGRPRSGSSFLPRAGVLPKPAAKARDLRSRPDRYLRTEDGRRSRPTLKTVDNAPF